MCGEEFNKRIHVYDSSCDETCNICEYVRNDAHNYSVREYDWGWHWMNCSDCGKINPASGTQHVYCYYNGYEGHIKYSVAVKPCQHNYGEWKVETLASVVYNGKQVRKCQVCKEKESSTIPKAYVSLSESTAMYNAQEHNPTVLVQDADGNPISDENYTISVPENRTECGSYKYVVTFENQYKGQKSVFLSVKKGTIEKVTLSQKTFVYNGKARTPKVTFKAASFRRRFLCTRISGRDRNLFRRCLVKKSFEIQPIRCYNIMLKKYVF